MNKKGFTLVELLAVIVIIGILGIITVPNVLEYFNESKREAMVIQENKLVESGDILVRDYCKNPVNSEYQLQCDELYKHLNNETDEEIIDNDDSTYTRYICVSTLKDKDYYSEKLQYSGEDCEGVVVYRINEDTDIQKDSFSVVKCGSGYKTIFENENAEDFDEFLETNTRADKLVEVFKECFPENTGEGGDTPVVEKKYQLTINFTEHNQYGQEVAEKISKEFKHEDNIGSYRIPEYHTGEGDKEEIYTAFIHSSTTQNHGLTIDLDNKIITGKMPDKDVTINIAYAINQYNVTFIHKDAVLDTTTFAGETHENDTYKLFNGETVNIPYKAIENYKIVSHSNGSQKTYTLNKHEEHTETILYQQEKFNLNYDLNGGDSCNGCEPRKTEYLAAFGNLGKPERKGYEFTGWYIGNELISNNSTGEDRYKSNKQNNNYKDVILKAKWSAKTYTITYHMGNGTSTAGHKVLGTKKCTYDETCTLDTFASLGTAFLYSKDPNYGWGFAGWTNYENTMEIKYENGLSFTYNKDYNLDLYAIGKRKLNINSGIAPTTHTPLDQQWNPYSTSTDYLTNITLPTSTSIENGWTFRGYKGGSTENNITAVTFTSDKAGTTFKANYNVYPQIRSIYERTLTMSYNGNGATGGSTTSQTTTQYYSSGYSSSNKNYKEQISSPTITLRANGFTKTGYTFQGWAKGSTNGTKYVANTPYTFAPGVKETNAQTMYALWDGNTYYIEYDCNGGEPEPYTSTHKYDEEKELTANKCKKGGSLFKKWTTNADGTGTSYTNNQPVKNIASEETKQVTIYAQWDMCAAGTYAAAGSSECTSCPTGYTSLAGSDEISDCYLVTDSGKYVAEKTKGQVECAKNGYCSGGETVYYNSTGGRKACTSPYSSSDAGSDAAEDCYLTTEKGKYVATAKADQVSCAANGYCPGGIKVKYGSTKGRTTCTSPYSSSDAGSDEAADCYLTTEKGKYVATAKADQVSCAANGYCPGGIKVNYGSIKGRTACTSPYSSSDAGSDEAADCYLTTEKGKYVATANADQVSCAKNGYCPGGIKVNYGSTKGRTACTSPYSSSDAGSDARADCYLTTEKGKYVATAKADQVQCTAGNYCPGSVTVNYNSIGGINACGTCKTSSAGASSCYTMTYAVSYDANGGSNPPDAQTKTCGSDLTLSSTKPSRSGYEFTGWKATNGTAYSAGGTYSTDSSTTMTAQWKQSGTKFGEYLLTQKGKNNLSSSIVGGMYRYQGTYNQVTNNYVCFGTTSCSGGTHNNMYRVMGVTSDGYVKLIKNIPISAQQFHTANDSTTWKNSSLKTNLNGSSYYSKLDSSWQDNIATKTWYYVEDTYPINLNTLYDTYTGEQVYAYETGSEEASASVSAKVGLMNMSDYLIAMGNGMNCKEEYQKTSTPDSPCKNSWIELYNISSSYGDTYLEWLMSTYGKSDGIYYAMGIRVKSAVITNDYAGILQTGKRTRVARPVIYLTKETLKTSGSGTSSDPYILQP